MEFETNQNIINDVNEISLIIKSIIDKYGYYPKSKYFINNKNDEKLPENYNFEKLFPNFTKFFKNLDYNFTEAIEKKTYQDENGNMSKAIKEYIQDKILIWNNEIVNYVGYYWGALDKKVKNHTLLFLYMTEVFINRDKLSDYDKNILYWAILFHDIGKFHEMNTIYKEDYSKNKSIDNDEKENIEFIEFFEKRFIKALYESFEEKKRKKKGIFYDINFNNFDDIEKFLIKLKSYKENEWLYEVVILIIFHQSLPNNNPKLHGRHINEPLLDEKYIKELFDIRLIELMRIILIYDSSSHCILNSSVWEQEIDKYFDLLLRDNFTEKEHLSEDQVIYLAELDGDVDDIIAVEYLYNNNVLKSVVLDPKPSDKIGKEREENLKKLGIEISYNLPEDANVVFCGGALTALSKYLENHKISTLVLNGGFVGDNIIPKEDRLEKFDGKETISTFNFNCDVLSTDKVLKSSTEKIGKIILVGKNVCHSKKNTSKDIWNCKAYDYLFKKYKVKENKCLHDMLMCHEGLCLLNLIDEKPYCEFKEVYPYNEGLNGKRTKWGSKKNNDNTPYRKVSAAVRYVD